jgi:PAS domain S-box-containing protein
MNREVVLILTPYLLSLALSLVIFAYTWQRRAVRGARTYAWFVGGQVLTILGFILELLSPDLQSKLGWDKFQWLTDTWLVVLPFLVFCIQFTDHSIRRPRLTWGYWLGLPLLFSALLLTDDLHHLIYPNPRLSPDLPFPELLYDITPVVYGYVLLYVYGAYAFGIGLLARRALQPHNPFRLQYLTIVAGFSIPIGLSLLTLFDVRIAAQRDLTPMSLALGNLVVAWGLFRYRLFDLVPIARERVLENLTDALIVVDADGRVVDMNRVALANVGKPGAQLIGRPVQEAFAEWSDLIELARSVEDGALEITARVQGEQRVYDLQISPLRDPGQLLIGQVFVARDVTHRKLLEQRYRQLSEELDQRVRERTEELRKSTERYRAVVENQTEFIVRWAPDGRRTFANEAYLAYFGLTLEEATASSFMPLVAEEDRRAVQAKLDRLTSGEVTSETEIHRVIRPDGSPAWHEWYDRAIRDEGGRIIEFQSVGRDVTERRLAEEALHELTRRLVDSQEQERKRIAQELHDELGQALTAIALDLAGIEQALPPKTKAEIRARLADARSLADEVDERISELALDLRPSLLDDLGLLPTLKWYVERYSQRLNVHVELTAAGLDDRLPAEVEVTLYRVVQEALTNIARHARARNVQLSLERAAANVTAVIQDDGRGFEVSQTEGAGRTSDGVGLLGIKDRVSTLGGRAEIQSGPGRGTRIRIEIPL